MKTWAAFSRSDAALKRGVIIYTPFPVSGRGTTERRIIIAREKTSGIYFKVSEKDRELIKRRMAQTQIRNMSAYIRKMCIDGYVINLDIRQLDEIGKLMRVTANNVNQIAKRVNSGGGAYREDVAEVNSQLETIRADFGRVLNDLSKLKDYTGERA